MSFAKTLERLRWALSGHSRDLIAATDVAELLRDWERLDAIVRTNHERPPMPNDQLKPVAGQCRFTSPPSDWQPCSYEHHLMVTLCPHEWPDYETRALYAIPEGSVVVPREVLERALQDCMFLPLEETVRRNIERNAAVRELRVLLAQQGQAVGS